MIKTLQNDLGAAPGGTISQNATTIADGIGSDYKYEIASEEHKNENGIIRRTTCTGQYFTPVDELHRWEPAQPVFISAQTGKGKNYFVENGLLRYVKDSNYAHGLQNRVLILTNRLSLWRQELNHLTGDVSQDRETEEIKAYGDIARVTTYQSFFQRIAEFQRAQSRPESQYVYVVCDEAHFFASDASFNPHTAEILRKIVETFSSAIRVYMSATPDDCIDYIEAQEKETATINVQKALVKWNKECEEYTQVPKKYKRTMSHEEKYDFENPEEWLPISNWQYTPMITYFFPRDYSYLNIKVYNKFEELYDLIVSSVCNRGERWLLFIDDWKKCQLVKKDLLSAIRKANPDFASKQQDDIVYAVNADSKTDTRYQQLLQDEKLGSIKVLISTSVLDNGVNFKDVHNVVVSTMSSVKCVQMAGRARRTPNDNQKNLYIKRFTKTEIAREIEKLEKQRTAYNLFDSGSQSYRFYNELLAGTEKSWKNAKHWFGKSLAIDQEIKYINEQKEKGKGDWVPSELYDREKVITSDGLYFNRIARDLMEKQLQDLTVLWDDISSQQSQAGEQYDRKQDGQRILERLLHEFGVVYDQEMDNLSSHTELDKLLEEYASSGREISDEELKSFRVKIRKLLDDAFGVHDKNRGRAYGYTVIAGLLKEHNVGYEILATQPQKGPWKVKRLNNTSQSEPDQARPICSTSPETPETVEVKADSTLQSEALTFAKDKAEETTSKLHAILRHIHQKR